MERIIRGRSATLTHTYYVNGTVTSPSPNTSTVLVTRHDGTTFTPAGSVTNGVGTASVTFTPTETALLDSWEVTWTATFGGQAQPFTDLVEVVGAHYFTLSEIRAFSPFDDEEKYPDATIISNRTGVEQAIEDACDRAFVPRLAVDTITADGSSTILLRPNIRSIRSVTVAGVAYTEDQLAALAFTPTGVVTNTLGVWQAGNTVIAVEHGLSEPPARVKRAAMLLARRWMIGGVIDERANNFANENGLSYTLDTSGFGVPEVNEIVREYGLSVGIA